MLLFALIACTPGVVSSDKGAETGLVDESVPVDLQSAVDLPGVDSTPPDSGDDSGAPVQEDPDDACPKLYDPDKVRDFAIEISDADWAGLQRDYASGAKNYHPVVFTYKDEVVDDAMIRLKGNPSFSWFTTKMQFVIAFNEVNPDGRFHGLRKLSLDGSWYEPTMLRDRVAWSMIRRQGELPAVCANSATLTINGAYYGLYTNIEYLDHEWLERVFGDEDATGTLWKYGYDAVSNAEAATGDVDVMASTTDIDLLDRLGDLSEWELEWASEIALGDDDGYWCCGHNFYLYEHPERGILWVPWDLDDAFDVQPYDTDPVYGYYSGLFQRTHFMAVTQAPTWGPAFLDQLEAMTVAMDPDVMEDEIDEWNDQISDLIEEDGYRSFGLEEREGALTRMRAWVPARQAYLESWIACQRGETTDADGDGYPVCDDTDDGDATVYPGATETCNGVDDDENGVIDDAPDCDDCARHDVDDSHFLFCRTERTHAEAEARCEESGGALDTWRTTAEFYLIYFYTWPVMDAWWNGTGESGGRCPTFVVPAWSSGTASCAEEHPAICRLP